MSAAAVVGFGPIPAAIVAVARLGEVKVRARTTTATRSATIKSPRMGSRQPEPLPRVRLAAPRARHCRDCLPPPRYSAPPTGGKTLVCWLLTALRCTAGVQRRRCGGIQRFVQREPHRFGVRVARRRIFRQRTLHDTCQGWWHFRRDRFERGDRIAHMLQGDLEGCRAIVWEAAS